jgi:hypothetical protein
VTLRVRRDVPSLRGGALVREWRRSLGEASERGSFRVAHYSLQGEGRTPVHLDGASSARWFDGWRLGVARCIEASAADPEVAHPRTWLLRVGWRRHGLVDPGELPGA